MQDREVAEAVNPLIDFRISVSGDSCIMVQCGHHKHPCILETESLFRITACVSTGWR